MSKISKKDKRMLEKFRAYLIAERKNRVLPTDGMTEIPLKTGTLQIPKGAICVTTCKLRDADQAGAIAESMIDGAAKMTNDEFARVVRSMVMRD